MCENGATSLPKIFISGQQIGGASGFSALAALVDEGKLEPMLEAARVPKK
jgi:glutaredoxin